MASCDSTIDHVDKEANFLEQAYEIATKMAVKSFIGVSKTKTHKAFSDSLTKYILENGHLSHHTLDPNEQIKQWENYLGKKHFIYRRDIVEILDPEHKKYNPRKIKAFHTQFLRVRKKRDKILKRAKGMQDWKRALYPPSLMMMSADRFGFISKLIEKAEWLSDQSRQSSHPFLSKVDELNKGFKANFMNFASGDRPLIDINNVMDGISGLYDRNGERVTIIERKVQNNGVALYRVSYDDRKDEFGIEEKRWFQESDFNIRKDATKLIEKTFMKPKYRPFNDDVYIELLRRKYQYELVNDILHGQTRYFRPTEYKDASERDKVRIRHHLDRMKKRSESDYEVSSPEIQETPDKLIKYIQLKQDPSDIDVTGGRDEYSIYILQRRETESEEYMDVLTMHHDIQSVFKEGFYKSNFENTYGVKQGISKTVKKGGKWVLADPEASSRLNRENFKEYINFSYMENQPDEYITKTTIGAFGGRTPYAGLWDVVNGIRVTNKKVYDDVAIKADKNQKRTARLLGNLRDQLAKNINPVTGKKFTDEEITEWIQTNIFTIHGIQSYAHYSPEFGYSTSDSYFQEKTWNYSPVKFTDETLEIMLDNLWNEMTTRMNRDGATNEEVEEAGRVREYADALIDQISKKGYGRWDQDIAHAVSTVHTEHRVMWTNNTMRRKDGSVYKDYLEDTYRNLHRNDLSNELIEVITKLMAMEKDVPVDAMEYAVNRVKVAFGHTDTIGRVATPFGFKRYDNQDLANTINRWIPSALRAGRVWDTDKAERMFLSINGVISSIALGMGGAMNNRTQIINPIIHYGWKAYSDMKTERNNRSEMWEEILNHIGHRNLLSVLNDIMLQDGKVDRYDFGFWPFSDTVNQAVTGINIPIPSMNFTEWRKFAKAGRNNFVKRGHPTLDKALLRMMFREQATLRGGEAAYAKELNQRLADIEKAVDWSDGIDWNKLTPEEISLLQEKNKHWWDLIMLDKSENRADVVEARLTRLVSGIADHKLRKFVTWKLGWWFDPSTSSLVTFQSGEIEMRDQVAMMALLFANQQGSLGSVKTTEEELYKSPTAVKIARDAVYQMMFGMSPTWLGEAFSGPGRTAMQYKAYTLFQAIHDSDLLENYWDSSDYVGEGVVRLFSADKNDTDAMKMRRALITRISASVIATGLTLSPMLYGLFRVGKGAAAGSFIRGAESPVVAWGIRGFVWSLLVAMGMGGSDEEEGLREDWGSKTFYLFAPVVIGMILRNAYESTKKFFDY